MTSKYWSFYNEPEAEPVIDLRLIDPQKIWTDVNQNLGQIAVVVLVWIVFLHFSLEIL